MTPVGFPHSEIRASKLACGSTRLIAACHVLHRLSVPRHPPYALTILMVIGSRYAVFKDQTPRSRRRIARPKPSFAVLQSPKALKTEQQLLERIGKEPNAEIGRNILERYTGTASLSSSRYVAGVRSVACCHATL